MNLVKIASVDAYGLVVSINSGSEADRAELIRDAEIDGTAVEIPPDTTALVRIAAATWDGAAFAQIDPAPSFHHVWRGQWVDGRSSSQQLEGQIATLKAHRWDVETGGLVVGGVTYHTDTGALESYSSIAAAISLNLRDPAEVVTWNAKSGDVQISLAEALEVYKSVLLFKGACRLAQNEIIPQIDPADPMQIDVVAAFDAALITYQNNGG